ncbi:hypothetical protein K8354_01185 [Polaribacter litorisediminis]|uniref:hypothetical protein n=1 Tax=Polaribacter litorisediminis TaxID=1908341 RepID=UPI001CBDEED3|nr:hypothetical protein [Polaribacter litorisediminis]UAM98472.1 hypothetical protein K8354_01185 [Polaribacter litorisediminis]
MKPLKIISFLIGFSLLAACSDNLNFNQLEDYVYTSKFTVSLIHFKVARSDFPNSTGTTSISSISDQIEFKNYQTDGLKDILTQLDLTAALKNDSKYSLTLEITFLNIANEVVLETEILKIQANKTFDYFLTIDVEQNPEILETRYINYTVALEDDENELNSNDLDEAIELKSSLDIYLESKL